MKNAHKNKEDEEKFKKVLFKHLEDNCIKLNFLDILKLKSLSINKNIK